MLTIRYLPAYPYILSAPLHTYAGLICFYLAQPPSARQEPTDQATSATQQRSRESTDASEPYRERESTVDSDLTATSSEHYYRWATADETGNSRERSPPPAPDANLLRQAKGWFTEALKIDPDETVAKGFRDMVSLHNRCSADSRSTDRRTLLQTTSLTETATLASKSNRHEGESYQAQCRWLLSPLGREKLTGETTIVRRIRGHTSVHSVQPWRW